MKLSTRSIGAPILLSVLTVPHIAIAQRPAAVTIRAVSAPSATSSSIGSVSELREIADGKVLVNDGQNRALTLFDATLQHPTPLSDAQGAASAYPRFAKLISYTTDSSLFYDAESRTLIVVDPQGKFGRVLALPNPLDFNSMTSGGFVSTDDNGHLIYQGQRSPGFAAPCRVASDPAAARPSAPKATDSVVIIRADFEKRTVDTVGRAKTTVAGLTLPETSMDANCNVVGAKMRVNPSIPAADSWTVTSRGAIAIVRSHDYHIDWINADGTRRSTPKMPFDWRRLTDKDKQAKIDSARKIIDSLTARGGYRLRVCAGGRSTSFNANPTTASQGANVTVSGGVAGGSVSGGSDVTSPGVARDADGCQTVTVAAQFVSLDSMADYIAPIRENSAHADVDGNVWILPTTSASANGGLLYDVVNSDGELFERVQLPAGRNIAGFGHGGVLYLSNGDSKTGYVIEKVKIVR